MVLDRETADALQISYYLKQITPYTPLGEKWKHQIKPYTFLQLKEWEIDLQDQQELIHFFTKSSTDLFVSLCELIDDLDPYLLEISQNATSSMTWFHLKRFLLAWLRWGESVGWESIPRFMKINQEEQTRLVFLLKLLQKSGSFTTTFEISQLGDETWLQLNRTKNKLTKEIQHLRRQRQQEISKELQRHPNFQGEWVVSRHQDIAYRFSDHSELRLIRESIYELVYELAPNEQEHELQNQLMIQKEQLSIQEQLLFERITVQFGKHVPFLRSLVQRWARLDFLWAKCRAAKSWDGVKPIYQADEIQLTDGVLPLEQERWNQKGHQMTPITLGMKQGCTLIIGPNMGGKTTALRVVGLCSVLAQYGLYVPAREFRFPFFSWIRTWIGDHQNPDQGLSSFGAEMNRLAEWINREDQGLILLDEIGRGTNPIEGSAISYAITSYLQERQAWALHVTHFSEALRIEGIRGYRIRGFTEIPKLDEVLERQKRTESWVRLLQGAMDYHLVPLDCQDAVDQQAIAIAEICGLPTRVIEQAREIVKQRSKEGTYGTKTAFGSTED